MQRISHRLREDTGKHHGGERKGQQHGGGLGGDDDVAAAVAVGDDAADGRHEKDGDLAGKSDAAEKDG